MDWFKLPAHNRFLDAKATLGVVSLGLLGSFYHRIDLLVLGHQSCDELDVMDYCNK